MNTRFFDFFRESFPLERAYFYVPLKIIFPMVYLKPYGKYTFLEYFMLFLNVFSVTFGGFLLLVTSAKLATVDLVQSLKSAGPALSMIVSGFKFAHLFRYRLQFGKVIDLGKAIFFYDNECHTVPYKQEISRKALTYASRIAFMCYLSSVLVLFTNGLFPILQMTCHYFADGNFSRLMPFNCYLPPFFESFPQYPVFYAYIVGSAHIVCCVLGSIDGGFAYNTFIISCIFKMIQYDIEALLKPFAEREEFYVLTDKAEVNRLQIKLGLLIQRHIDTQELSQSFMEIFGVIIFMHFFTSAITICTVIFVMLVGPHGFELIPCIWYLVTISTQLFIYCYGASLIEEESSKIAEAAYASYWYHVDLKIRKMVLLIMLRSQKSVVLQVPFFKPSLPAFNTIMSTAGSYVALMKSFI